MKSLLKNHRKDYLPSLSILIHMFLTVSLGFIGNKRVSSNHTELTEHLAVERSTKLKSL